MATSTGWSAEVSNFSSFNFKLDIAVQVIYLPQSPHQSRCVFGSRWAKFAVPVCLDPLPHWLAANTRANQQPSFDRDAGGVQRTYQGVYRPRRAQW